MTLNKITIERIEPDKDGKAGIVIPNKKCEIDAVIVYSRASNSPAMRFKVISPDEEIMVDKQQSEIGEKMILYPRKDVSHETYEKGTEVSSELQSLERYMIVGDMVVTLENASKGDVIDTVVIRVIEHK